MLRLIPIREFVFSVSGPIVNCRRTQTSVPNAIFHQIRSYRAAILEELNKPLLITEINNKNKTDAGMIRVKVQYCSLNLTDVLRMSDPKSENYLPQIAGCEFSGEVLEVGNYTIKNFKPGDKCLALLDYDHQIGGGLAEESIVPESDCFPISISSKIAAVVAKGHGLALLAFTQYCELDEHDIVIVIAGAAGNGLAAVQVAKNVFKAKVYVISETENSSGLSRDEGAHKTVSVNEGLSKAYKFLDSALSGQKAKVVYDAVGQGLMYLAADFVDPEKGHFISVDPQYDPETFPSTKPEFKKTTEKSKTENKISDSTAFVNKIQHIDFDKVKSENRELYEQIIQDTLSMCEEELINPYVSSIYGLHEVNEAVECIKAKKYTGKFLIDISKVETKENDKKNKDNDDDDDDDRKKKNDANENDKKKSKTKPEQTKDKD